MAAGSDNTLEILIKLGYVGTDQADAARDALKGIKEQTGDLSTTLPEGSELWGKYKNALADSSTEARGFNVKGKEMHMVMQQLNQVVPGLGTAFRSLVTGMGPLAVIALSIQAATTWWNVYKEKAEAAAAATAAATDKMRAATRAAREENEAFAKSFADVGSAVDLTNQALKAAQAVLEARLKSIHELTGQDTSAAGRQGRIDLLGNVMASTQGQINQGLTDRGGLNAQILAAKDDAGKREALTKQLADKDAEILALRTLNQGYERERRSLTNVAGIENFTDLGKQNPQIYRGVQGIDAASHGEKLSQEQVEANRLLSELFANHRGGLDDMAAIIKHHLDYSTSQADVIKALSNRLNGLERAVKTAKP